MENEQLKELISAFIDYRNLLIPLQENLKEFTGTYFLVKEDVDKLNIALSGEVKDKMSSIYSLLANQAEKSNQLTQKVDQFLIASNKYSNEIDKLLNSFNEVEKKIINMNNLEGKVEAQIQKIENLIEAKENSYSVKDLQKSMDTYSKNLQGVGEFINKEVAGSVIENAKTLEEIKKDHKIMLSELENQGKAINDLAYQYKISKDFINTVVQNQDVNEAYLFEVLDKWAKERKVKIKK